MAKLDDQLKAAILRMPVKEKDKLLLRLVAKDAKLVRRLIFELLEGGETRDERAEDLRRLMLKEMPATGVKHLTPGYLLLDLRHWNARINEHVQATKDKVGEVTLVVLLMVEAFRRHYDMLRSFPERRSDTFAPYLVRRLGGILKKAEKLHEDYHIEFRRDLNELLEYVWKFKATAYLAEAEGLPKKWG